MGRPTDNLIEVEVGLAFAEMATSPAPDSPPIGRTMKAAHQAARTIPDTEIVKAGELEPLLERLVGPLELFFRGHRPASPRRDLRDRRRRA